MRASTATRSVAGSGAFAFDLTVPGGQVKAAGVTIVGVLPTHRRRGYLHGMMRSQIDAARERGEPVAVLWATEDTIYGQFGYGMASMAAEIDLPREHAAAFAADRRTGTGPAGDARRGRAAGRADLRARGARRRPACIARTPAWWQDRC